MIYVYRFIYPDLTPHPIVTRAGKKKPQIRRSATRQKLEEGAKDILENGWVEVLDKNRYRVSSMSSDAHHEVLYVEGLWRCDCKYHTSGHTQCKHTYAVKAIMVARETVTQELASVVNMPERQCPECGSLESGVTTEYGVTFGTQQVFRCTKCKYRFVYRPGFKRKQFSDEVITDVLVNAAAGHPPGRIVEWLAKRDIKISERTIQRWIKEYAELMEKLTKLLRYNLGDIWTLDELYMKNYPVDSKVKKSTKTKKDDSYLFGVMDSLTRFIPSYEVATNKSGYDATELLKTAITQAGSVPDVVVADGLDGFKKGFMNSVQSKNPDAVLVADVGINGKHVNNNKRERLNGEIKDCMRRARGFRSKVPGLVRLTILYHNFIHKNKRDGITPAQAAGVFVEGPDIFMTLIRNAALMGT